MKSLILCSTNCLALLVSGCASVDRYANQTQQSQAVVAADVSSGDSIGEEPISNTSVEDSLPEDSVPLVETVAYRPDEDPQAIPIESVDVVPSETAFVTPVDVATVYTLADIEQIALNNNPAITAASAAWSKASGLRQQVGARPNPTIGYFGSQLADAGTQQQGIYVDQEFVRGNKLALNRQVLRHTTNAQRWEMETQRYRVLTDVRVRFYEAIGAQQQLDATTEFAKVADRGVQVAIDRRKAEEGTRIDVLQAKTLLSEINLAGKRSEAAYYGAWKDLAAVAGVPDLPPTRLTAEIDTPDHSPDWDAAYAEIASQSPELAVANALVCEKQAILKRQQVQMIPNVTAQLGAGYDKGTGAGLINLQVGAPIPVFNNNSGNVSAAYADYTRALENVKRIEMGIKSRMARAAQEFDASLASVNQYKQEILPQVEESLTLSEEAYRAGELNFLQVLVVRRSYYDSNIRFIQARAQLAQASAKVDGLLLSGGLDAPQDYTNGDGLRGQTFSGQ